MLTRAECYIYIYGTHACCISHVLRYRIYDVSLCTYVRRSLPHGSYVRTYRKWAHTHPLYLTIHSFLSSVTRVSNMHVHVCIYTCLAYVSTHNVKTTRPHYSYRKMLASQEEATPHEQYCNTCHCKIHGMQLRIGHRHTGCLGVFCEG